MKQATDVRLGSLNETARAVERCAQGIGWGLPAALGVKLALPERPVVALVGDGSAMYTCQALWTAAHDHIAVVFVILNNTSYRILKQRLRAQHGAAAQVDRYVGMDCRAIDMSGARAAHLNLPLMSPASNVRHIQWGSIGSLSSASGCGKHRTVN